MKSQLHKITGAILAATALACVSSFAQSAVTTTSTTTTAGTISDFSPDTIVVRTESSPEPIRYSYSKTTTYVDDSGTPVSLELVKSGLPVTVSYIKEGDHMVANRVIVHKKTTTTTTDGGTAVVEKKRTTITDDAPAVIEKKSTTTTTSETK